MRATFSNSDANGDASSDGDTNTAPPALTVMPTRRCQWRHQFANGVPTAPPAPKDGDADGNANGDADGN
ncbi:MAG: hypothetical protein ACPH9K_08375, partial [Candidatus Poseidoniaceae archaeon]